MTCILCNKPSTLLWHQGRARIYQCETGHYWETVELVTAPVHDPVPLGSVPLLQLIQGPA